MDSPTALTTAKLTSIPLTLMAAGYGICASHNIVPRLYREPASTATSIFTHVFHTGGSIVVPTGLTSAPASLYLAYPQPRQRKLWLAAAAGTLLTLPWTRLWMFPGIMRLIAISEDAALQSQSAVSREHVVLLRRWVVENYVRSAMFLAGGLAGVEVRA